MTSMTYNSLVNDIKDYLDRNNSALIAQIPNFITLGEMRCAREVKNLGLKTSAVAMMSTGSYVYLKPNRWLETISINFGNSTAFSTTYRAAAAGVRTITVDKQHNFVAGDAISVFNVGGTGYNGNFTVTASTQFTITYTSGSATEASTADTGGIVTAPLEQRTTLYPRSYEFCNEYWKDRSQTGVPKFYADYNYTNWLIVPTPDIDYPFEVMYFQRPIPLSETNQTNWFTEYARDLLLYACLLEAVPYLKNDQRIAVWKDYYMQSVAAIKRENNERINDATIKRVE